MSVAVIAQATAPAGPRIATESLRAALLWLMAFSGAFVFIEPSPYELTGAATLFVFAVTGLALRPALLPLLLLLVMLNLGYAVALLRVIDKTDAVLWVLVSMFLSATAIFFAAALGTKTEARLRSLLRGYVAASVLVSLIAIAAYLRLFGPFSDLFVIFDRARGTFKDPNVLGAFLVLPGLIMARRVLVGRRSEALGSGILLLVMIGAMFLTFSRAAWGQFVLAALLLMWLTFVTSTSPRERLRIVLVAMLGAIVATAFVALLLSVDQVAELFRQRATLTQSYDTGHTGRFGRYALAIQMMLDYPAGLGPLQFLFPEAPHNAYLNAFVTGGWLAGIAYLTLTLVTLTAGLRFAFVATPWQSTYHVVYAAYVGVAVESIIIDSDHWRHYFLILGVLWGLMAVTRHCLVTGGNAGAPQAA
jgi:hypothetical protein